MERSFQSLLTPIAHDALFGRKNHPKSERIIQLIRTDNNKVEFSDLKSPDNVHLIKIK